MDCIKIRELEIFAHHGVYDEEKEKGQHFYVNATLFLNTQKAALNDDLMESVNYGEVCQVIHQHLTENTYKLLETCAETTAREILIRYPLISRVQIEVRKPEAPIALPFSSVSVEITRSWNRAYVALGSNLGDSEALLNDAVNKMKICPDIRVIDESEWIVTKPYGGVEQPDFVNGAVGIDTLKGPEELLAYLQSLENQAGRQRTIHWGPRTLDLDILFYNDCVIETENLSVPHPDMHNRDFVLKPMKEIAPNLVHPVNGKTIRQMWKEYKKSNSHKK